MRKRRLLITENEQAVTADPSFADPSEPRKVFFADVLAPISDRCFGDRPPSVSLDRVGVRIALGRGPVIIAADRTELQTLASLEERFSELLNSPILAPDREYGSADGSFRWEVRVQ